MALRLVPLTLTEIRRYVAEHHRHNRPPLGWRFGVGVVDESGALVGVGVAGQPVSRRLDDGLTVEITRVCTDGHRNANSRLYGALCRAAAALGYQRVITYTLQSESGSSLRAAGFTCDGEAGARPGQTHWSPSRPRRERDLFGKSETPNDPKLRWSRQVGEVWSVIRERVAS